MDKETEKETFMGFEKPEGADRFWFFSVFKSKAQIQLERWKRLVNKARDHREGRDK